MKHAECVVHAMTMDCAYEYLPFATGAGDVRENHDSQQVLPGTSNMI